jgi:hypothetical protein
MGAPDRKLKIRIEQQKGFFEDCEKIRPVCLEFVELIKNILNIKKRKIKQIRMHKWRKNDKNV